MGKVHVLLAEILIRLFDKECFFSGDHMVFRGERTGDQPSMFLVTCREDR